MSNMPNFRRDVTEPRRFAIDDDVFECAPRLPAGVVTTFAHMSKAEAADQYDFLAEILDILMFPASAARFAERMKDPQNPIDIDQIDDVFHWVVQEYANRPTVPPSTSGPLPTPTGSSSTDTAQPAVAIL
jgi:hypothetical protein